MTAEEIRHVALLLQLKAAALLNQLTKAELEEIASGGPHAWTPGACPARYAKLDYGVHILSAP